MGEPITVGIGQMINPSTFWVSPLPSSLNLEAPGDQCIYKVLQLESELKKVMEQGSGDQVTANTPLSTLVAVAVVKEGHRFWHRGRIESVAQFGRKIHANVFLIDYGQILEEKKVEDAVLVLPCSFSTLPPLAFRMVLAGLLPATMDYDLELRGGMAVRPARSWDGAAFREVERILGLANDRVGRITNWVKDRIGRYHGQLDLLTSTGERVILNQWLVETQFAVYSAAKEREELTTEIDHGELVAGDNVNESFDSSLDSEFENELDITHNLASVTLQPLPQQPKSSVCDMTQKAEERRTRVKEMLIKLQAKKKAAGESAQTVQENESMWEAFRKSGNSEIDVSSRASSNLLPGGVLVGKFHENVLFNLHADGINDQRKKFEEFVRKPCT